ncbi:hypothetical protein OG21DRAFT_1387229, partial [Imleria badia]
KVKTFYPGGVRSTATSYLRLPGSVIDEAGGTLDLRNSDGTLMALICSSMPQRLKDNLMANLIGAFDGKDILYSRLVSVHESQPFECVHFSWYNRYTTQGKGAPTDVHPHELHVKGAQRTNISQLLPYQSSEQDNHEHLYQNLKIAFEDAFEWIENTIREYLPEEYEILMRVVHSLPGNSRPPVAPFVSLVVNINVHTEGHRDRKDLVLCLVIPIGEFEGGELVMYEQGLVVELRSGDFIVFCS